MAFEEFKTRLLEEKAKLEKSLGEVATKNPENPNDWEVKAPEMNPMVSDQSELADAFEELESQAGLEWELEGRLKKVNAALARIEEGSYGKCAVDGAAIDEQRLLANPLADTCVKHSRSER
ncbi:MAG: TraR/DksA C4-type zinc finger protein [Patescibacteria group bacterium]